MSETRTTKEVQLDERNNTLSLNAPVPDCVAAKASKTSKVSVAGTNNGKKWEYQTVTAKTLCLSVNWPRLTLNDQR